MDIDKYIDIVFAIFLTVGAIFLSIILIGLAVACIYSLIL